MTRLTMAMVLILLLGTNGGATAAEPDVLTQIVELGGKIEFSAEGKPVAIDLYNGNNPLKGKGGRNLAVNDAWLEKLAGLTTLTRLGLANCDVSGPGLKYIAGLTKLEGLDLTLTPFTDEHLVHLAGLTELKSLGLASSQCTGTGFQHLHALKKLTNVNMHFTPANDAGLAAVAAMPNLERLWVVHAKFTDAAASSLAKHRHLKRLGIGSSLNESSSNVLSQIAGVPLEELELFDKQATDEAVAFAAGIPTLRMLNISYGPAVTDAAIDAILKMPSLEDLRIGQTKLSDAGISRLAELKRLKMLSLVRSRNPKQQGWTDAAIENLKKARPELTIDAK